MNRPSAPIQVALDRVVVAGVFAGSVLWVFGAHSMADVAWAATVVLALVPLAISVAQHLIHRETGVA